MEQFVGDSTEFEDFLGPDSPGRALWTSKGYTEVQLIHASAFVSQGHDWTDLTGLVKDHFMVRIAPRVFVTVETGPVEEIDGANGLTANPASRLGTIRVDDSDESSNSLHIYTIADSGAIDQVGEEALGTLLEVIGQKSARYVQVDMDGWARFYYGWTLLNDESSVPIPVSADALAHMNGHERIKFQECVFSEDHCQALASLTGTVSYRRCQFQDRGRAVFEAIRGNQGPTRLSFHDEQDWMEMLDAESLGDMLSETKSLRLFSLECEDDIFFGIGPNFVRPDSLVRGLSQNESLTELTCIVRDDDEWTNMVQSLRTHPTLQKVFLTFSLVSMVSHAKEDKIRRAQVLLDVLQTNDVLVDFSSTDALDDEILRDSIRPRLQANLHQARLKALLDETDTLLQNRLVLAALSRPAVREDPAFLWLLLSNFYEVIADQYELVRERRVNEAGSSVTQSSKRQRRE